jgi:hypothetical protein
MKEYGIMIEDIFDQSSPEYLVFETIRTENIVVSVSIEGLVK